MTEPPVRLRLDKNRPGPLIPSALETYRALREDGGENGKRVKTVLERLRSDPGKVRAESLRYRPDGWMVLVEMADESTWWIIWRQPSPDMVDVLWIGPQPGPDPLAYPTEMWQTSRQPASWDGRIHGCRLTTGMAKALPSPALDASPYP